MRSPLRTLVLLTAGLGAAAAGYAGLTVAPAAVRLDGPLPSTYVTGAYHVHTVRSDGTGTVDDVAAAAARAGLAFVIFTDHGNGTRPPDPPSYRHGVLCIDAVEVGTSSGHLVAIGLRTATPYRLAGEARDVIEDVHRLGGHVIVAHPDSPRNSLRWRGQHTADGIEWLNADSEWRDESPARLAGSLLRSVIRPAETVASLFSRPTRSLQRWDMAARSRPVFGIAAVDAHARIGADSDETGASAGRWPRLAHPSYEAMFRTLAQTVSLDQPLSGDAGADSRMVIEALTAGRSFSIVRAFADPAVLEFTAEQGGATFEMGSRLPSGGPPVVLRANAPQAPGARITLLRNGREVAGGQGSVTHEDASDGVYRAEAAFPGAPGPWLMSNPIVIGSVTATQAAAIAGDDGWGGSAVAVPLTREAWTVERDPDSAARTDDENGTLRFDFRIADGPVTGQYAAIATELAGDDGIDRIRMTARASTPMRVSVQVRLPGDRGDRRWRRSVYLDGTSRDVVIRLQDLEPTGTATSQRPVAVPLRSLLLVVDTLHTPPATAGSIWLSDLQLGLGSR